MINKIFCHFFSFNGRSGRLEYFFHGITGFVALVLVIIVLPDTSADGAVPGLESLLFLLFPMILIAAVISELAITVRRLHDLNESGWNIFMGMIPIYNIYQGIKLLFFEGSSGPNQFGLLPGTTPAPLSLPQSNADSQADQAPAPLLSQHKERYKSPYLSDE